MSVKTKVVCDLTGKEISPEDFQTMSIIKIVYPVQGSVKSFDGSKDISCIKGIEEYELHVSKEKSKQFMHGIQKLIEELTEK